MSVPSFLVIHQMLFMNQCTHARISVVDVCMPHALKMIKPIQIWINAGGNLILGHILLHNIANLQFRTEYLSYKPTPQQIRKNKCSSIYTAHRTFHRSQTKPYAVFVSVECHLEDDPQSHL